MTKKNEGRVTPAGVFLVDKPAGMTSFAVVARVRRILHIKKVGHAGTLDPFATGLLVVCVGRPATKMISRFMAGEKEYLATLRLGVETETLDTEGKITKTTEVGILNGSDIEASLQRFRGVQMQTPPVYSALKHKGKPLYYYARRGIEIKKEPREITVSTLERIDDGKDLAGKEVDLQVRVVCSKGTYIRSLAADIGKDLGCGAHLVQLRRIRSGCFSIEEGCLTPEDLTAEDARKRFLRKMLSLEEVSKLLQYSNDLDTV